MKKTNTKAVEINTTANTEEITNEAVETQEQVVKYINQDDVFSNKKPYRVDFGAQTEAIKASMEMKFNGFESKGVIEDLTPPEDYPDVPNEMKCVYVQMRLGEYLNSLIVPADSQREDQYDADFVAELAETAIKHRFIAPAVIVEKEDEEEPGKLFYELFDGKQRTNSLFDARASLLKSNLPYFDSCPFNLIITRIPPDMNEGDFFRLMNKNNKMSNAQKIKGNLPKDAHVIINAIKDTGLLQVLVSSVKKSDGFETERIARADDILMCLALATINPSQACTNTKAIGAALADVKLRNPNAKIKEATRACKVVIGAFEELKKETKINSTTKKKTPVYKAVLSRLSKAMHLIVIYSVVLKNPKMKSKDLVELIKYLYDVKDGSARTLPPITLVENDSQFKFKWEEVSDGGARGNDITSTLKRIKVANEHYKLKFLSTPNNKSNNQNVTTLPSKKPITEEANPVEEMPSSF